MRLAVENVGRAVRHFFRTGRWCRHPGMGCWWPCNFGADEVRLCSDCGRIEKRQATVGTAKDAKEVLRALLADD
jgi:hypothetical protein